jgi:hypothetical protein
MFMKSLLLLMVIFAAHPVLAWSLFGPGSYEDCILQSMKGVTSDTAASQIRHACRNKFPVEMPKRCKTREMSTRESSFVTGNGNVSADALWTYSGMLDSDKPKFTASLYNGNQGATIESIIVAISADNIKPPQEYEIIVNNPILPRSSGEVSTIVQTRPTSKFEWRMISIRTCR